jgi:protein required for attachment to host cells
MLIPHGTLVLVVDGGRMIVLRNRGSETAPDLDVLQENSLHNPPSRTLTTDAPGRSFASSGPGRSAYPDGDVHQRREDRFGREAVALLQSLAGDDTPMILIAPPHMLGDIRAHHDTGMQRRILAEIDKDLTHDSAAEIARFLRAYRQ